MATLIIISIVILLLLIIIFLYVDYYSINEGFVSFQQNKSIGNTVIIPQYNTNSQVLKLYDNLFFDTLNGNVIEVDSTTYTNGVDSDTTGITISNIYILPRTTGLVKNYVSATSGTAVSSMNTSESLITSIIPSTKSWSYLTKCTNTDTYQLFYLPCGKNTYIHIMNISKSTQLIPYNVISFIISDSNYSFPINKPIKLNTLINNNDNSTSNTIQSLKSKEFIRQLGTQTYLDTFSGDLILVSPKYLTTSPVGDNINGAVIVMRNSKGTSTKPYLESSIGNTKISSINGVFITNSDKELIIYFADGTNSYIMLIIPDIGNSISNSFKIENSVSYGENGTIVCGNSNSLPDTASPQGIQIQNPPSTTPPLTPSTIPPPLTTPTTLPPPTTSTTPPPSTTPSPPTIPPPPITPPPQTPNQMPEIKCTINPEKTKPKITTPVQPTKPNESDFYKWFYWVSMSNNTPSKFLDKSNNNRRNRCNNVCNNCNNNGCNLCNSGCNGKYIDKNGNMVNDNCDPHLGIINTANNINNENTNGKTNGNTNKNNNGINELKQDVKYGVNQAGQAVQYGVDKAGNSVEYVVDKSGQGVQYGVDKVGNSAEYIVDKSGQFLNAVTDKSGQFLEEATDDIGYALRYLIDKGERNGSSANNNNMGYNAPPPPNYINNLYTNNNTNYNNGNNNRPDYLPITSDFSAFGR
jgi:hypothetical protein